MANIFDYLDWRDISFEKVEFNEVDNLILSRIAYFPFDKIVKNKIITLKKAYEKLEDKNNEKIYLQKEDKEFFKKLAYSIRFGNLQLTKYRNKLVTEEEKQFSAISILLPINNIIYVSYRGTDNTIVGWKEDLNMSFQDLVPSQIDAMKYLEEVDKEYPNHKFIVGGHSKGGNLAVYASIFCNDEIKDKIIDVYNNDGPGFQESIIKSEEYEKILPKIHTYLPQSSIIGRLLNHKEESIILKSTQTGIMQHDLYTWQVLGDKFVKDVFTNSSEFIDTTITTWLKEVSTEQRGKFIDVLFEILNATGSTSLSQMGDKKFETAKTFLKTYRNIDDDSREILMKTLSALFKIAKSNIKIKPPSIHWKQQK